MLFQPITEDNAGGVTAHISPMKQSVGSSLLKKPIAAEIDAFMTTKCTNLIKTIKILMTRDIVEFNCYTSTLKLLPFQLFYITSKVEMNILF